MKALFIVGFWNSGTTLLVDVLRNHPNLSLRKARYKPNLEERTIKKLLKKLGADFWDFSDTYEEVVQNGFKNYHEPIFDDNQQTRFRKMFRRHFWTRSSKILLLKNPYLFYYFNFINTIFQKDEIKKIVILRNGYAQVVSKDYWKNGHTPPEKHLLARAVFWKKSIERFFNTWHNDKHCLTIRYENLSANPEKTIQDVCTFLDIPFEPLRKTIPAAIENRMTNWNKLDDTLKNQVNEEIEDIQQKVDTFYPVIKK